MPERTVTDNGRVASRRVPEVVRGHEDDNLRKLAVHHLDAVRKFKHYLWVYLTSMAVLTPIWIITQYESANGWPEHLSSRSRYDGDWDPWLIWVGLIGAFIVGIQAYRAYIDRPETEADIEREIERLKAKR